MSSLLALQDIHFLRMFFAYDVLAFSLVALPVKVSLMMYLRYLPRRSLNWIFCPNISRIFSRVKMQKLPHEIDTPI